MMTGPSHPGSRAAIKLNRAAPLGEQTLTREVLAATYGGAIVTVPATGERVILPADHHGGHEHGVHA